MRGRTLEQARAALGEGTTLPVLTPSLAATPTSVRTLRRAHRILAALRDAGVRGGAHITASTSILGLAPVRVDVHTFGAKNGFSVHADTYRNGRVSGPDGESVRVSLWPADPAGHLTWGTGWIDIDQGGEQTRSGLIDTLRTALASRVWDQTVRDTGAVTAVHVTAADGSYRLGQLMLTASGGSVGELLLHLDRHGNLTRVHQRAGDRWVPDDGAFGRHLRSEVLDALGVDDVTTLTRPFLDLLHETTHRHANLSWSFAGVAL